ncbi:DUF58 domain-containing protein [Natronosalvus halobius]|uniref:DUF58 domain-containing protein n=1 Tax=Natronosalvus halobius TaxID=2953746 RepID=UPI00209EC743|nr:DUF58 domain-containing protein [Natronosalvus halobius]USZ72860.1 DUF58 domain-containing protein [Natronosalvus halobius]
MSDANAVELGADTSSRGRADAPRSEPDSVSVDDTASDGTEPLTSKSEKDTIEAVGGDSAARTTGTVADERPISSDRWMVALGIALVAIGVGVIARDAAVFLSSVVALTYAAYGYATTPPSPQLAVERRLDPSDPVPGESVSVTVTVSNHGTDAEPDIRVADQPPTNLVLDGASRTVGSLAPGESLAFEYAVHPRRGTHVFGDVVVESRNVSGSERLRTRYAFDSGGEVEDQDRDQDDCNGANRLTWNDALERLPLAGQTIQHPGRVETDVGGEGLEFHSLRPFQPSDPMRRVDWKRLARTGELTTIEFREERAASVVVVVDARDASAVVRNPGELDGRSLSIRAAEWVATTLLAENNRVGVALYGGRGDYLLPRTGRDQLARVRRLLDGEWCGSFGRPSWLAHGDRAVDRFCRHLADEKQLVFVTPLLDDAPVASARRFRAYGHEVTVVCPGVADRPDLAGTLERDALERRLSTLRSHGVRVVEWRPDESLHVAVDRSKRRWST